MIYILKLKKPLGNHKHRAQFYLGYCADGRLEDRLAEHRAGRGAAMTRAAVERNISFEVVLTLPGGRDVERKLKSRNNHQKIIDRALRGTLKL